MSTYNLYEIVGIRCSSKRLSMTLNYEPHADLVGMVVAISPETDDRTNDTFYKYTIELGSRHRRIVDLYMTDLHKLPYRYRNASHEFKQMTIYKNSRHSRLFFLECEFKDFVDNKPIGLEQSLKKVHNDTISSLLYSVPTFYMSKDEFKLPTKEEIKKMINNDFGVLGTYTYNLYKKIIFNGPCTIVLWTDGSKTIARVSEDKFGNKEMFDPEKGVAICFMKKMIGHTETNKVLRKAAAQYMDNESLKTTDVYSPLKVISSALKELEDSDIAD